MLNKIFRQLLFRTAPIYIFTHEFLEFLQDKITFFLRIKLKLVTAIQNSNYFSLKITITKSLQ